MEAPRRKIIVELLTGRDRLSQRVMRQRVVVHTQRHTRRATMHRMRRPSSSKVSTRVGISKVVSNTSRAKVGSTAVIEMRTSKDRARDMVKAVGMAATEKTGCLRIEILETFIQWMKLGRGY